MRILRVAQNLYPEVPGGGTYHVHAMSRDQAEMGHDITVLTVTDDDSLPQREQRYGYTVVRCKPTVELLGNEISAGITQFLRNAKEFDLIHAHSHLYFSTNLAALKRRFGDIPLAITNHGLYSQNAPEWLFNVYLRTAGRWTFNQADVVFCYTDEDRERVHDFGVESRIEVVSNGVDTERFTPDGPTSDLIDHDGPVVLFVGRLVDGKRPLDAIKTAQRLNGNVKLVIVGDGPKRSELEERAEDNVEFLGRVQYTNMPKIYRSGDVLILPSRAEGLPRTILEAFSSAVPVVSSHLNHTAPIVQKAGKTVSIGDISGFATALEFVLDRKEDLGQNGRNEVVQNYKWDDTVEKTTRCVSEIAEYREDYH